MKQKRPIRVTSARNCSQKKGLLKQAGLYLYMMWFLGDVPCIYCAPVRCFIVYIVYRVSENNVRVSILSILSIVSIGYARKLLAEQTNINLISD